MATEFGEARKRVKEINEEISRIKTATSPEGKLRRRQKEELHEITREKENETRSDFVKKAVFSTLLKLNQEVLGGQGTVVEWSKETSTHTDHWKDFGQDGESLPGSEEHTIEADIVRLIVPQVGTMALYIPVPGHFYLTTFTQHDREYFCERKAKYKTYLDDKESDPSEKKLLSNLNETLLNILLQLHERALLDRMEQD